MLLSIITICYNDKKGLEKTIKSVLSQTIKNFEFIIIDGNSTDGSVEIIQQYSQQITYWTSEPDSGIYNAMNKGIKVATGDYCLFLNSGDIFYSNNVISNFILSNPTEDILCGDNLFNLNGKSIKFIEAPRKAHFIYFMSASLPHQSAFIKTSLLKENRYDENYKIVSDFIFFFDALILNNSTYRKLNFFVANSDLGGISNTKLPILFEEKNRYLYSVIPPTIVNEVQTYAWNYKDFWGVRDGSFSYYLFVKGRKFLFLIWRLWLKIRRSYKQKLLYLQ